MDRVDSILESQVGRGIHIFTCKRMAFSHGSSQLTVLPIQSHQCHSRAKKEILEISQARWGSRMGLQVTSREQTAFCWSSVRHNFGPLNGRLLNLKGDTLKLACLISMFLATAWSSVGWSQDVPDSNNFLLGKLESLGGDELVFTYAISTRVLIQQEHALAGGGTEVRSVPQTVPQSRQQTVSTRSRAKSVDGRTLDLKQLRPGKSVPCVMLKNANASITPLQKLAFSKQVVVVWPVSSAAGQGRGGEGPSVPLKNNSDEVMPPAPDPDLFR